MPSAERHRILCACEYVPISACNSKKTRRRKYWVRVRHILQQTEKIPDQGILNAFKISGFGCSKILLH